MRTKQMNMKTTGTSCSASSSAIPFNYAMATLPVIRTQAYINRIEVWVTNKTGATTDTRDIVGLMDLARTRSFQSQYHRASPLRRLPNNGTNDLYQQPRKRPGRP